KSSSKDVYEIIEKDLTFAESNLPESPPTQGRPSLWVAKTVLADVYFYEGLYNKSMERAEEVIKSNNYALVQISKPEDFNNLFGPDLSRTSEEIFYLNYSAQSTWQYPV